MAYSRIECIGSTRRSKVFKAREEGGNLAAVKMTRVAERDTLKEVDAVRKKNTRANSQIPQILDPDCLDQGTRLACRHTYISFVVWDAVNAVMPMP